MRAGPLPVVGGVARELVRLGRDRVSRPSTIARHPRDLDAAYLSRVLDAQVHEVEVLAHTEGTTDHVRLRLEGVGVPESVFVKMAASAVAVRLFTNLMDLGSDEVAFYRDVRPCLTIEAPIALGFDVDRATKRVVLVLEDLEERGCAFGNVLGFVDEARAGAVLDSLAAVHAQFWQSPRLGGRVGNQGSLAWIRSTSGDPMTPLVTRTVRWFGRRIKRRDPSLAPADGRRILDRYGAVARELDAGPHTLLHGDPHPGNCYYPDDDRVGLLDWQAVRRGNPIRDVAYFLVLALDPAIRRSSEAALLERYRDSLAAASGPSWDRKATWAAYRKMAAYPYVAATFTAGLSGLQDASIADEGLRRAVTAIEDLDTAEALDALSRKRGPM